MVEAVHDVMALPYHGMEPKGLVVVGSWTSALTLVHENTTLPTKPKAKGRRFMLCQCVLRPGQLWALLHGNGRFITGDKGPQQADSASLKRKNKKMAWTSGRARCKATHAPQCSARRSPGPRCG